MVEAKIPVAISFCAMSKGVCGKSAFIVAHVSLLAVVIAERLVALLLTEERLVCVPFFQLTCVSSALLIPRLVNLCAYMALGDSESYMRSQKIKVLGGGAVVWATALLTKDIYITAWANPFAVISLILFADSLPAKRLHGYSALSQVKDIVPILALSCVAAVAALAVQLLGLSHAPEILVQCAVFALVYLGGAGLLRFEELAETASLVHGVAAGVR